MYFKDGGARERSEVRALAESLYTEHRSYLFGIARRNASNSHQAEESLQEAFASFVAHFDPSSGAPALAWLTLTLKRECWARCKREDRRVADQRAELFRFYTDEAVERAESVMEARERLARLRPSERAVLVLIAAGYSYAEIGRLSGWNHAKVNRCAYEGRIRLRELAGD
jgi:RNA polymerase sigma factor (sigma-70 family)